MHPLNVSLVDECKQLGNELFKSNQLDQAVDAYSKAIHQYELAKQQHQQSLDTTTRETLAACYANRAQCNLVLHPHSLNDIKRDCDTAIQLKPNYFKALFRRAKVLQAQHNYVDAMKDLTACLSIEPQNKLVRETAGQVRTMIAIWEEKNRRPDVIIDKLRGNGNEKVDAEQMCNLVRLVVKRFEETTANQKEILDLGFPALMMQFAKDQNKFWEVRVEAIRSLVALFSEDEQETKLLLADYFHNNPDLVNGIVDCGLKAIKDPQQKTSFNNSSKTEDPLNDLARGYQFFIAALGSEKNMIKTRSKLLPQLVQSLREADVDLKNKLSEFKFLLNVFNSIAAKAICGKLSSETTAKAVVVDSELRHNFVDFFLTCFALSESHTKDMIVSSFVMLSGRAQAPKLIDPTKVDPQEDKNAENDKPHIDEDLLNRCYNLATETLFHTEYADYSKSLRSLSCILQAAPIVGNNIIANEKILPRIVELAVVEQYPANELAAEVLALASSDSVVRNSIAEGGFTEVFLDLMDCKDSNIRAHAGVALSKLAPVDKEMASAVVQKNRLLKAMMDVISEMKRNGFVVDSKPLHLAVEAISYLTIFIETKKALATFNGGSYFKLLLDVVELKDRSLNYGIAQIIYNMTTSTEDIKKDYDQELEQLRKLASKSLKNNQEKEVIESRAGSVEEISIIRKILVDLGAVKALYTGFHVQVESTKKIELSDTVQRCLARILVNLATESQGELRGKLVQQRAMRLLLDLTLSKNEKCRNDSSLALARIGISTNPTLYPTGVADDMAQPLLRFLKSSTHELHQFETLLALTNLTSSSESIRRTLWKQDCWYELRMALTSENWKVQVAALEAQTNMVMCEEAVDHFRSEAGDQDIKIFLAFCRSEEFEAMRAASGALAMLSYDEEVAKKIAKLDSLPTLEKLLKDSNPEISKRAQVTLDNIKGASASVPK